MLHRYRGDNHVPFRLTLAVEERSIEELKRWAVDVHHREKHWAHGTSKAVARRSKTIPFPHISGTREYEMDEMYLIPGTPLLLTDADDSVVCFKLEQQSVSTMAIDSIHPPRCEFIHGSRLR